MVFRLEKEEILERAKEFGFLACIELTINAIVSTKKRERKQTQIYKANEVLEDILTEKKIDDVKFVCGFASVKSPWTTKYPKDTNFNIKIIKYNEKVLRLIIESMLYFPKETNKKITPIGYELIEKVHDYCKTSFEPLIPLISPHKDMKDFEHYSKLIEDITEKDYVQYKRNTDEIRAEIFVQYVKHLFRINIPRKDYFDCSSNEVYKDGEPYTDIDYMIATKRNSFENVFNKILLDHKNVQIKNMDIGRNLNGDAPK